MWCTELISIHGTFARARLLFLRASIYAFVYIFGVNLFIVYPSLLRSVPRVSRVYWHRLMLFSDNKSKYGWRAQEGTVMLSGWRLTIGEQRRALWSQVFNGGSRLILILTMRRISQRMLASSVHWQPLHSNQVSKLPEMQMSCEKNAENKTFYDPVKTRNPRECERSRKLHFDEHKTTKNI